jgi:hypothetical protein
MTDAADATVGAAASRHPSGHTRSGGQSNAGSGGSPGPAEGSPGTKPVPTPSQEV